METISEAKSARLLTIYARLLSGRTLRKAELAAEFGVTQRSIQRDLESLRCFLIEQELPQDVLYDRAQRGYRLTSAQPKGLTNSEILAVCKILLESRSMIRSEMMPILDKLIDCCVPMENRKMVQELISNEKHHYVEPHHGVPVLNGLWEIGQAVQQHRVMEIEYRKLKGAETVRRTIEPVGILFSEYYFYLAAYIRGIDRKEAFSNPNDQYPTISASSPSVLRTSGFLRPMPPGFRRANFGNGCSSCTAESCKRCSSPTPAHPSRPFWTACPRRKFSRKKTVSTPSGPRCSAPGLRCG